MVVTRSHCLECKANGGRHDARDHNRSTNAAIGRDAARVAASHRPSARSRGKKSSRALVPTYTTEGVRKHAHRRGTVSTRDATSQHGSRKTARGTKPRDTVRPIATALTATNDGRGPKLEAKTDQPTGAFSLKPVTGTGETSSGQNHPSGSRRRGTKRARDDEDNDIPGPAGPARQIRRRIDPSPCEGTRRSARLASKRLAQATHTSSNHATTPAHTSCDRAPQNPEQAGPRQAPAQSERTVESRVEERGIRERSPDPSVKSEHDDGCSTGSEVKTESSERTLVAGEPTAIDVSHSPSEQGQSLLPPYPVKKEEEEVDLALIPGSDFERSATVDGIYGTDTDGSESRSSSIESFELVTPEPPGEAGPVRVYDDEESSSTLGMISNDVDEDDQEEFLPLQLPNGGLAGETDDEDENEDINENEDDNEGRERSRSLAPEPEDGLLAEIRLGRIPGLATPERSIAG